MKFIDYSMQEVNSSPFEFDVQCVSFNFILPISEFQYPALNETKCPLIFDRKLRRRNRSRLRKRT